MRQVGTHWRGVSNSSAGVKDKEGGWQRASEMLRSRCIRDGGHEEGSSKGGERADEGRL